MLIKFIVVGKVKEKYLEPGIEDFCKRIQRFSDIQIEEVPAVPDQIEKPVALAKEAEAIISKIGKKAFVVTLTPDGKALSSETLAEELPYWLRMGKSEVDFIIGSSRGLDKSVYARADYCWAFGPLTLTHGVARFIAVEQIYRAFKINANEAYHK